MSRERNILITGSSGLIGRALCHHFGSAGAHVIGLDREGPPYPPPNTDCIFADLTSDESLQTAMFMVEERYGQDLDAVIHLAAYYNFSGKKSPLYHTLTYEGTERLFRELERFNVAQFIFSSTMLVHAPTRPGELINESSPKEATWAYPESKIKTEKLIERVHGSIPCVILRIAGVYTDLCESIPLAHQIQRIYESQLSSHLYPGDINAAQSFVHLEDLVDTFDRTLSRRANLPLMSTYLIGEADAMTYDELQQEISRLIYHQHWTMQHVPKPIAKAGAWLQEVTSDESDRPFIKPWMIDRADDCYVLDTTKALVELGWSPQRTLRRTLPKMIEGVTTDPVRWYSINKLQMPDWLKTKEHQQRLKKSA